MSVSIALASVVASTFVVLGVGKILALPPMRRLATNVGFSTASYRRIGVLELAGAAGVAIGVVVPLLGGLAGVGLLSLLAGAVVTQVRNGQGAHEVAPAVICTLLVGSYLAVLIGVLP